jgi:hypothetical protein
MGELQQCSGNPAFCAVTRPGTTASMEFILAQTGTSVSGTWTINAAEPRVAVTGSVAPDGSLNLSGRPPGSPAIVDSSRLTVAAASMSGTLTYTVTFSNPAQGNPATTVIGLQGVTRQ